MAGASGLCPSPGRPVVFCAFHCDAIQRRFAEIIDERTQFGMVGVQHGARAGPVEVGLLRAQRRVVAFELTPFVAGCGEVDILARLPLRIPA